MQELCMFCGDTTESALHVLVMCPFAAATWDIFLLTRPAHQVRCNTMNDWLREMLVVRKRQPSASENKHN